MPAPPPNPANPWQAAWIGVDRADDPSRFAWQSQWFWTMEPDRPMPVAGPGTKRYFRRAFELPDDGGLRSAELRVAATRRDAVEVWLNGVRLGGDAGKAKDIQQCQPLFIRDVRDDLRPGRNLLAIEATAGGIEPHPVATMLRLVATTASGRTFVVDGDSAVLGSAAPGGDWQAPEHDDSGWRPARPILSFTATGDLQLDQDNHRRLPGRQLRREFALAKPVARATARISGLGWSELWLNGSRVGDAVLSPGLTNYDRHVFYLSHDVTALLREGANAVGVWLGNGRYRAPRTNLPVMTRDYGLPKLLFQLDVEFADGSTESILSDESWSVSDDGPIRANNEYDGEEYDARRETPGWTEAGFDDGGWRKADPMPAPSGELLAEDIDPVRILDRIPPAALSEPEPGVWIVDFGENLVGWCRIRVCGERGRVITIRHGERLYADGSLDVENLRSARATDSYTLRGDADGERYEPRFTHHGFRYAELRGWPGTPEPNAIEACLAADDLRPTGSWHCSNECLNQFHEIWSRTLRNVCRSILMDGPQRDERQPWAGDVMESSRGQMHRFDLRRLFRKWCRDMAAAQRASGSLPDVAFNWDIRSDTVTWPAALVYVVRNHYEIFGDRAVVEDNYPAIRRWLDFIWGFSRDGIVDRDHYGDWCLPPESQEVVVSADPTRQAEGPLIATAYTADLLRRGERFARLLGHDEDAERFAGRASQASDAFHRSFFREDPPRYGDNGTVTAMVLALAFGLVPPDRREALGAHLAEVLRGEHDSHVATGLIGQQHLMRALSRNGHPDLALEIATQTTYPSFGYMIAQGASTLWELWNADTADPDMTSLCHVMLAGDQPVWMFEDLAGIAPDPEDPGFARIRMAPVFVDGLDHVEATRDTPHGEIHSHWQRTADGIEWRITVPEGAEAEVLLPASAGPGEIALNGGDPQAREETAPTGTAGARRCYRLPPGQWTWTLSG